MDMSTLKAQLMATVRCDKIRMGMVALVVFDGQLGAEDPWA